MSDKRDNKVLKNKKTGHNPVIYQADCADHLCYGSQVRRDRFSPPMCVPRWDTADAEIMLPPSGSKGLCERFPVCKHTVGQNVALHARPAFLA